ncbi:hypothetical protein QK289_08820 [Exiguobacterium antarcticum]|uniref:Uncharacterized protein n=2 Tax=Bacillales Family XII. Incertae Sedis TaxID=539742 RepID=A0ABT6R2P4_9BACL|nr:hypothetical protein [Exiguobacterium sp. s128]MDI3235105.1 hypothetical protein [Exiguobacterium antarcticum]
MQKKMLNISILLMVGGVFGNILFTRLGYFPNADFRIMSIPLATGAHYFNLGLVLLAMTLVGLVLLPWFLEKKQFSKTVLSLVLIIWLPYAV